MKGVNIFLAEGFEDIEALATRDVLLRGGVDVKLVGIGDEPFVCSSHGLCVGVDMMLEDFEPEFGASEKDVMIFPGGMPGSKNLGACRKLISLMNEHYADGGCVAAICAAPSFVLGQLKGIDEAVFTCYDGCEQSLVDKGATFLRRPFVQDGRIITGRGPGHTLDFALAVLALVKGEECAAKVKAGMVLPCE